MHNNEIIRRKTGFKRDMRRVLFIVIILTIVVLLHIYDRFNPPPSLIIPLVFLSTLWLLIVHLLLKSLVKIHIQSESAIGEIDGGKIIEGLYEENKTTGLESTFNILALRAKRGFEELQRMSGKIEELNQDLSSKVNILLTIMQTHEIFSQGLEKEKTFNFILSKLKAALSLESVILMLKEKHGGSKFSIISEGKVPPVASLFSDEQYTKMSSFKNIAVIDSAKKSASIAFVANTLGFNNIFLSPLILRENTAGYLIGGNNLEGFSFSKEHLDSINIFSKNIVLISDHDRLSKTVENLEVYDALTDLYNKRYITMRLDEEIKRAAMYQRPCGLLLGEIVNFEEFRNKHGALETEKLLKKTAKVFKETLRPIDVPARLEENKITAILLERNRRACETIQDKIKKTFNEYFIQENLSIKFRFAVGANPINGSNAEELFSYVTSNLHE
ncbi:MAG: GGDEF domain-containing protein [Candidatus Omnitrophota bacterium]